ncbi:MAG TPA: NAD-dependent epimerase/dehydratase family protein, partial [Puia sp.]
MATILITGGTGLIGNALSSMLMARGHRVIILSRGGKGGDVAHWDPYKEVIDPEAIGSADFIVHLAGAGVADKRWTAGRKKEIVESRTRSSALLV